MANLFGAPMQQPVFGTPTGPDYKLQLAQSLIGAGSQARPVNTPLEGAARLATALLGGVMARNAIGEQRTRSDDASKALAQALAASQPWRAPDDITSAPPDTLQQGTGPMPARPDDPNARVLVPRGQSAPGTGGRDAMVAALMGNRDTAPMGAQIRFNQIEADQKATDERALIDYRATVEARNRAPQSVGPGAKLIGPDGKVVAEGGPKESPASVQEFEYATANGYRGSYPEFLKAKSGNANQGSGPFMGNGMDAQVMNMLLNGDPASPAYAAAFNYMAQPRQQYDANSGQLVTITPRMDAFRPPMGGAPAMPQQGGGGTPTVPGQSGAMPGPARDMPGERVTASPHALPGPQAQSTAPAAQQVPTPFSGAPAQPAVPPNLARSGVTVEQVGEPRTPFNEMQGKAAGFADRMTASEKIIGDLGAEGTSWGQRARSAVPLIGNELVSEPYQKLDQARRDFINAQLRRESGAVISPEEFDNANKQYFPQPGDSAGTIAQKTNNRRIALEAMRRDAGRNYKGEESTPRVPPPPPGFQMVR